MRLLRKSRSCRRSRAPQPGPVGQVAWLSETPIAFARWCLCGIETAIAFAGEKWAFLAQFSGAEVLSVSAVPCWGRTVVLSVSRSPRCRALCAKKFALRHCSDRAGAKKFAQHTKNGSKWVVYGALGELLRGNAAGGVPGEFFRGNAAGGAVPGEF